MSTFIIKFGGMLLVLLMTQQVTAQKTHHFISGGPGVQWQGVREQTVSPLLYNGAGLNLGTSFYSIRAKTKDKVDLRGSVARLTPELPDLSLSNNFLTGSGRGQYYWQFLLPWISKADKWQYWIGPAINASWDIRRHNRLGNSAYTYEGWGSVNASLGLTRTFHLRGMELAFDYDFNFPLSAFVVRPGWVGPLQTVYYLTHTLQQMNWTSQAELAWVWRNCNQLFVAYDWNFYQFKGGNKVESVYHALQVGLTLKVN